MMFETLREKRKAIENKMIDGWQPAKKLQTN